MVVSSTINEESGIKVVDEIVKKWDINECWLYCIDFMEKTDTTYQFRYYDYKLPFLNQFLVSLYFLIFRVKWSIPTRRKPIPAATASVYFTIDISKSEADIFYVLEAQRLIHTPVKSVFREKWLKDIVTTKTLMMADVTF